MNALLVRVGTDLSSGGGRWNGPVHSRTGRFAYVPIPESRAVHPGMEKPYGLLAPVLSTFGISLPHHLWGRHMHLDPDFDCLTYGDQGERAKQLRTNLSAGDWIVFYAGLNDVGGGAELVYALVGVFVVDDIILAADVHPTARDINAHSRRVLQPNSQDVIVRARQGVSGRLERCLPIGEWRDRAYRVRKDILNDWGGLSVKNGYLQRSARLPKFIEPMRFRRWLESKSIVLLQSNN